MDSHGADGTVTDITLTTVRVQNFDNTFINIPAYDLVSKPFQNWDGMVQSGARRIKRAINIDVETIKFLDADLLKRLQKIQLISDYLKEKINEVRAFNAQHDIQESILNGRHLTNVGTFRAYAVAYLNSPFHHRPYANLYGAPAGPHHRRAAAGNLLLYGYDGLGQIRKIYNPTSLTISIPSCRSLTSIRSSSPPAATSAWRHGFC